MILPIDLPAPRNAETAPSEAFDKTVADVSRTLRQVECRYETTPETTAGLILALSAIAIFAALLLLWVAIIHLFKIPPFLLPTPGQVVAAANRPLSRRCSHRSKSPRPRLPAGLLASIVAGVLIALVFAQWRWVRSMFYPYTILLQTVPIIAIAPLILMWVGTSIFSVGLIAFIICLARSSPTPRRA